MSRYWSRVVHDLVPYVPGEQPKLPNLIKLNTNENPYGPSPQVLAAIGTATSDLLKLYPDPNASELKQTIAAYHGLQAEQIFVGNGSDEVLAFAFLGLLKHDQPLLFPDITYSFYPVYCNLYDVQYLTIALRENFSIAVEDYQRPAGAIIFPNPNAPTGHALPLADIERLLQQQPNAVVVIDEAYIDFGAGEIASAVSLVNRYPNLLVVQTFSKSRSLAGLRVGFALGHKDLIDALERIKNSFNSYPLDRLAQAGAVAAFQDQAYFEQTRNQVIATREQLVKDMQALGFEIIPSAANFIFARHPQHDAGTLAAKLRERNILVRHFKLPRIEQYLRITVGTDAQCGALVAALKDLVVL